MNIALLPRENLVDSNGMITLPWKRYFSELTASLQYYLSNEGYILPQTDNITDSKRDTVVNKGLLVYDNPTNSIAVNLNGVFKKITTENF